MPCHDPRTRINYQDLNDSQKKVANLEDRISNLEAMLCALCTETDDKWTLEKARVNGQCQDIMKWFVAHSLEDINRLKKNGLPKIASNHEKDLFQMIKDMKI